MWSRSTARLAATRAGGKERPTDGSVSCVNSFLSRFTRIQDKFSYPPSLQEKKPGMIQLANNDFQA